MPHSQNHILTTLTTTSGNGSFILPLEHVLLLLGLIRGMTGIVIIGGAGWISILPLKVWNAMGFFFFF